MEKGWTLFMDRDGVVNEQIIGGYVMDTEQFVFLRTHRDECFHT